MTSSSSNKPTKPALSIKSDQAVTALSALAHPVRLGVFKLLVQAGEAGMAAGDMAAKLNVAPSALSFHLKDLSYAQLVISTAQGRQVIYRAEYAQMNALIAFLTDNCCQGKTC